MTPLRYRLAQVLAPILIAASCSNTAENTSVESAVATPTDTAQVKGTVAGRSDRVTLVIESWRPDDTEKWENDLIPAFEASNPDITIEFAPSEAVPYDEELEGRLRAGLAGDIVACRPFGQSNRLYEMGYLAPMPGELTTAVFEERILAAWTSDQGDPYCLPLASVIHGFLYNVDMFNELGLTAPTTEEEFFEVLDAVAADGLYAPLALGLAESWQVATVGFQNIGPSYWRGESGRTALLDGTGRMTDPEYKRLFEVLQRWGDYLPEGADALTYEDSRQLFILGNAAVFPTGSWELDFVDRGAQFELSAFPPPDAGDGCYITDHLDMALGMNASTPHPEETMRFLAWTATAEFALLYENAMPGFYSLFPHEAQLTNQLALTFGDFRSSCDQTIRSSSHLLSLGNPNFETEIWRVAHGAVAGTGDPETAGQELQDGLDQWFEPSP